MAGSTWPKLLLNQRARRKKKRLPEIPKMTSSQLAWQAHDAADYDAVMTDRCSTLLTEIITNERRRQAILSDPRELHRELFKAFAPPSHPEYSGSYRGSPGTSLASRRISAASQLEPNRHYEFCLPNEVAGRMSCLLQHTQVFISESTAQDFKKLIGLTYTFCWFGKIHPFLDGNGHVQRAIFAAMATEFGYPLSARFAIHPRPYDRLLATALEIFTRAPVGKEMAELELVAEYLGFFIDGPFNSPRKHVGTATLYPST
jgi:fido (protein-threonine AMPylation protein)